MGEAEKQYCDFHKRCFKPPVADSLDHALAIVFELHLGHRLNKSRR